MLTKKRIKAYLDDQFRYFKNADKFVKKFLLRYYMIIFIFGFVVGGFADYFIPMTTQAILNESKAHPVQNAWGIIEQNYISMTFILLISFLSVSIVGVNYFMNGFFLGNITLLVVRVIDINFALIGLLPHGIIELTALFLTPLVAVNYNRNKKSALKLLILIVVMIFIAGMIEFYVTSGLLNWYVTTIKGIKN